MRGVVSLLRGVGPDQVDALESEIVAERMKGSKAAAEIERLEEARRTADSYDQARAIEEEIARCRWAIERADTVLPRLQQQLAEAKRARRERDFDRHRLLLITATRKLMAAMREANGANVSLLATRHNAHRDLGDCPQLPFTNYTGVLLPESVEIWLKHTERAIETLEKQQLPRPPAPRSGQPATPAAPNPNPVPVALAGAGAPQHQPAEPTPAALTPDAPAAVTPPPRRREQRRDPPPGEGERQVHIMVRGPVQLPGDGGAAFLSDRVTLPEADARRLVEGGVGDFVADPAPIIGEVDAKLDLPLTATKRKTKSND